MSCLDVVIVPNATTAPKVPKLSSSQGLQHFDVSPISQRLAKLQPRAVTYKSFGISPHSIALSHYVYMVHYSRQSS
jgi:hypothetical protein